MSDALRVINERRDTSGSPFSVYLATGFMPLHLETFLTANLLQRMDLSESVEISSGVYGDLAGNLIRAAESSSQAVAVVVEWSDLDPRLGLRRLGGWAAAQLPDIVNSVKRMTSRLESQLSGIAQHKIVTVLLPTLPLPPVSFQCSHQAGNFELLLSNTLSGFSLSLVENHGCRVINPEEINSISPLAGRFDIKADLKAGFPYTISHAAVVGDFLARLLRPMQPKKGLITDLDDTVWDGILGEVGVEGVSWDLENHSQIHGLYQQLLAALSESGTLIGVASKNELPLIMEGFEREDIILTKDKVFPFEASWGRKSESIKRILEKWNVGPEAVVFVDDSLMEIAEVEDSHPQIECFHFPKGDDKACYALLYKLRDIFGKEKLSEEDAIRRESLQRVDMASKARQEGESFDAFLQGLDAELTFDWSTSSQDSRAFELVNKTNQFNLNGRRIDESGWRLTLEQPNRMLLVVSYRDKFGPLGKIAVVSGLLDDSEFAIDTWVMSCRSFSRRIEYACLDRLFRKFDIDLVSLDYRKTERNGPLREFLEAVCGETPEGVVKISRQDLAERCPRLFNSIKEVSSNG